MVVGVRQLEALGVANMTLSDHWTRLEPVPATAEMHTVFDAFARNRMSPFLPVVDRRSVPIGVVHENDLKPYAYGRFGRDLVKREALARFIKPSAILEHTVSRDELLNASASNPNPDGLLLTKDGAYLAVLLNSALLRLFDANRVETQVRLAQAQKMEAIGTLAGGIAHDLNNLLTPILGNAQLLREMVDAGDPLDKGVLDDIVVSGMRAKETVGRILAFSRQQKTEQKAVALSAMIRDVLRLMGGSLPATIATEMCLETADDKVFANPAELQQVIMNLCTNAYHAMRPAGGHLQVVLADHSGPLLGWSLYQGQLPDSLVRLTVRDTGSGIPHDILPKIFDPFFTTKKQGEGTGMGLAIVHGVVTRCKGAVSVESEVGQGTAFHIYLPRHVGAVAAESTARVPAAASAAAAGQPRVRVLYVDDEFQVARLAQRFLSRYGLDVEVEVDSCKALTTLQDRLRDFDVLVTDQTMPRLSGLELAGRVRDLKADFPIIMCTGFSEVLSPEIAKAAGIREYLSKPPDYAMMANTIRACARVDN